MRKFWKILKVIVSCVVIFLAVDLAIIGFFALYRPRLVPADDIVVLGAAVKTEAAYQRSLEGLKLYQEGLAKTIVVSGGVDYPRSESEAAYMEQAMRANSTSTLPIIVEDQSGSTYENLANTMTKIGAGSSIIIVSDDYHLARAVLMAERLGFKKVSWSSPNSDYYSTTELAFYYFREEFAMIDYIPKFVTGK